MIPNETAENRPLYSFSSPIDIRHFGAVDSVLLELITTRAFQRLKSIRFLGGIDYLLVRSPNGISGNIRHTRYQHSLGVARLALLYSAKRELSFPDRRLVCAAALLHDIGHAPLSHSLEPVFKDVFGLEHHHATEGIIAGRVPLGREVYEILREHDVDIERVTAIIAGEEEGHDGFFAGPINFDTIEGILRTQTYAKLYSNAPSPELVTEAALLRSADRDRAIVDQFWMYKDEVYHYVINSRTGVLADFACQLFMRRYIKDIKPSDYFLTESQMFRKLPGLRSLLTSRSFEREILGALGGSISYKVRRFLIDPTCDFYGRNDRGRYRQTAHEKILVPPRRTDASNTMELTQDLFDDDRRYRPVETILGSEAGGA